MTTISSVSPRVPSDATEAMRDHYEAMAASQAGRYASRFDPQILETSRQTSEAFRRFFESIIGPNKPRRVLDLGCGTGLYHPVLAPMVGELVGVDNSEAMLAQARRVSDRRSLGTVLRLGDAADIPFPDWSFDMVVTYDVLHHVSDLDAVAEEIRRVLKPGGRFVGAETTMLYPPLFLYNLMHREEWGLIAIRPGRLRRAFRHFLEVQIRPDSTRFFPHHPAIERALDAFERYVLRGPLGGLGARYIIEAAADSEGSVTSGRDLHRNASSRESEPS